MDFLIGIFLIKWNFFHLANDFSKPYSKYRQRRNSFPHLFLFFSGMALVFVCNFDGQIGLPTTNICHESKLLEVPL